MQYVAWALVLFEHDVDTDRDDAAWKVNMFVVASSLHHLLWGASR